MSISAMNLRHTTRGGTKSLIIFSLSVICFAPMLTAFAEERPPASASDTNTMALLKASEIAKQAVALLTDGDAQGSLTMFRQAIDLDPANYRVLGYYGLALIYAGQEEDALLQFKKGLEVHPKDPGLRVLSGECYQLLGRTEEALDAFKSILTLSPGSSLATDLQKVVASAEAELKDKQNDPAVSGKDDYLYLTTRHGAVRWTPSAMPLKVCITAPVVDSSSAATASASYRAGFVVILKQAFEEWATASGEHVSFDFVDEPDKAQIVCAWQDRPISGAVATEAAESNFQFSGHELKGDNMKFWTRDSHQWPISDTYFRRVCLHEIGHALGLAEHSYDPDDVMFFRARNKNSGLTERDKKTLIGLYELPDAMLAAHGAGSPQASSSSALTGPLNLDEDIHLSGKPAALNVAAIDAFNRGDYDGGVALLEEACNLDQDGPLQVNLGRAYARRASVNWNSADFPTAERDFRRAMSILSSFDKRRFLEIDAEYQQFRQDYGRVLAKKAFDQMQRGAYKTASAEFKQSLEYTSGSPENLCNYGVCLMHLGMFDDAISQLRSAIAVKPDFAVALAQLGSCYFEIGRVGDALIAFKSSLQLEPSGPLAETLKRQIGNLQRAVRPAKTSVRHK